MKPLTQVGRLPVHRIPIGGTRAFTALVAFEAGSRTERREENGVAHFLEHLVFKGGEKYRTHRDVNETGERLGARLNAYTSQDMVAFHVTARAESAAAALDLLTDFIGRPRLDPEEIERERGVVVQEIARTLDDPADRADLLVEQAAWGDHPLGRPILGTSEGLQALDRDAVSAFRARRWCGERGGMFLVGNLDHLPGNGTLEELLGRLQVAAEPVPYEPAPSATPAMLVEPRDSNQSHLRIVYRVALDVRDQAARAALTVLRTLLGGSPASILREEIREQRGLAYSVFASDHCHADAAVLEVSAGLEAAKLGVALERIRTLVEGLRTNGVTAEGVERGRSYAAGRRVLAFESTGVVAAHAAEQAVLFDREPDIDATIAALDSVTTANVARVAERIDPRPAVACVGPHGTGDLE